MEPISTELIDRYVSGDCSPEEEAIVLNWYNSFESRPDPYIILSAQQQQELRMRMLVNIKSGIQKGSASKIKRYKNIIYLVSAAAIIILIIRIPGIFSKNKLPLITSANPVQEIVIYNKTQTIYKQILPDNSVAWLSPGARIEFKKNFGKHFRQVKLSGESFFEVTKDKAHPFVIYSNHLTTTVWGTSFRVRDIKNTATAEVAVVTGKVSVKISSVKKRNQVINSKIGSSVMLLPKQKVVYETAHRELQVEAIGKLSSICLWQRANLSFENVPLKEVFQTLDKQYNVEITLQDKKLNNYLLQADFNDLNLPDVMEILKKLLKLDYVTDGRRFMLQRAVNKQPIINSPKPTDSMN